MLRTVLGKVVLGKLLAYFVGGYADDGVLTRIEVLRQVEEIDSERAFLESAPCPAERVLDDVLEELTASLAIAESSARQQAIELRLHGLHVGFAEFRPLTFAHPLHSA
jgi:hypothetical protein